MKNTKLFTGLLLALSLSCTSEKSWEPELLKQFKEIGIQSGLPDYSYAGYAYGTDTIPDSFKDQYWVTDFGAIANDNADDTDAINLCIETAGKNGGGIVHFPQGRFIVNAAPEKADIVKINYSNIVLRGAGSGANGTTLFSKTATDQPEENSPWLSPFVVHTGLNLHGTDRFFSVEDLPVFLKITENIPAGTLILPVEKTDGLQPGTIVILSLQNTTDDGNLINDLMHPLEFEPFQKSYTEAGLQRARSFQWPVEIDKILDATHVLLKQPTRREIALEYAPSISIIPMLKHIGIEQFKFESAWDGKYKHHGNREMDYGWGAINFHRVAHGWIKDIHIDNYTQTTQLLNSRNITIQNVRITGKEGHYAPKMYHSSDNLVQDILVEAKMTHGPGLEGCSFGNVFRNMQFKYATPIDLHGIANPGFCPPMYNLFENIDNIERIAGGGAPQNLPHAGEYNTFWNLNIKGWKDGTFNEVFYSWIWRDPEKFNNQLHIDCHKQYLRSNLIGIRSTNHEIKLSVEHSFDDRKDPWIYIEGINSTAPMVSLYNTQLNLRNNIRNDNI